MKLIYQAHIRNVFKYFETTIGSRRWASMTQIYLVLLKDRNVCKNFKRFNRAMCASRFSIKMSVMTIKLLWLAEQSLKSQIYQSTVKLHFSTTNVCSVVQKTTKY